VTESFRLISRSKGSSFIGWHNSCPSRCQSSNTPILSKKRLRKPVPSAVKAGRRLLSMGVKYVLVTLGRMGVVVVSEEETTQLRGVRVKTVDTTGAGDAFCGTLAYGLAKGMRLHDAAELANNAAALSTTRLGAQEAMPTLEELHRFMTSSGRVKRLGKPITPPG
jgi:ribokinase